MSALVSLIIPVHNQLDYTLRCLESVAAARDSTPTEIIVVDDCSTDATRETLATRSDLVYIRIETNLGFLKSVNVGADKSRGEYLFLLNNDTTVKGGYLNSLVGVFQNFPDAAAVGSKLFYPDGTLQEAGAHLYVDGSIFNYGREQNPDDYRFNYVRKVDYCSAAALLVRKDIFFKLGKFDETFCPAYCEDTDFQLRATQAGYGCYYQPLSEVIHYEGVSHGKIASEGSTSKAYQQANMGKLLDRHRAWLEKRAYEPGTWQEIAVFPKGTRHVYIVADHLPPPQGTLELMRDLQKQVQVTFIPLDACFEFDGPDFLTNYDAIAQAGIRPYLNRRGDPRVPIRRLVRQFEEQPETVIFIGAAAACHFQQAMIRWRGKGVRLILHMGLTTPSEEEKEIDSYLFSQVDEVLPPKP